nr:hypothetical protein GCM10020063_098110 [Dactylosporangium thailandense]
MYCTIARRTAPAYAASAKVTGIPSGDGSGEVRCGRAPSIAERHRSHNARGEGSSHPAQVAGSTRSSNDSASPHAPARIDSPTPAKPHHRPV